MTPSASADVICIGGGLSGLTCAARAAELGLRVIVAERGEAADYPCNSRYSAGVFHASYQDVTLPSADLDAAMQRASMPIAGRFSMALDWSLVHRCLFALKT